MGNRVFNERVVEKYLRPVRSQPDSTVDQAAREAHPGAVKPRGTEPETGFAIGSKTPRG